MSTNQTSEAEENRPTNTPTAQCPWCRVADVAVESMQCSDRVVTGVDEDNGPVYWAECQRCGAQGPIVEWAADAIPKWNTRATESHLRAQLAEARKEAELMRGAVKAAQSRLAVLDGSSCAEGRAEGDGGCGLCGWCCKQARTERDAAQAQLAEVTRDRDEWRKRAEGLA